MAGIHNFVCDQGATFQRELTPTGSTGAPMDNTGCLARMQVRATAASASTVLSISSTSGEITLGGANGKITISVLASTTAGIPAGCYVYDLELVNGATVYRILQGDFEVNAEVTR